MKNKYQNIKTNPINVKLKSVMSFDGENTARYNILVARTFPQSLSHY
jgi:hypothetical protein